MNYTFADLASLARSPVGRRRLLDGMRRKTWPLMRRLGALHRRTLIASTTIVAVTGSFGKSSTTQLMVAALGLPLDERILSKSNSLVQVMRFLLRVRPGEPLLVFEVGIDTPGQMLPQATALAPDIAVITAVGGEHLETMGSLERIQEEKSRLLDGLRPGGITVLNGDDWRVRAMALSAPGEVWTFGLGSDNDAFASEIVDDWPNGYRFTANLRGETIEVSLPLLGRHMIPYALAALAVAKVTGVPPGDAAARIASMPAVHNRLQPLQLDNDITLLCDHAKNSVESLIMALDALAMAPGRKLLVISRIRDANEEVSPHFDEAASRVMDTIDELVAIGPGVELLTERITARGFPARRIHKTRAGSQHAIETVRGLLRPGDTVLLKARNPQKLDRLVLALQGARVVCDLHGCHMTRWDCANCAMLETGFADRTVLK